jgi:hypothetical protein
MAPKSVRLQLPMRPVDNITELDADAKFLSDIWPEGPGKAFYETVKDKHKPAPKSRLAHFPFITYTTIVHGCRFTVHSFSTNYETESGFAYRCSHLSLLLILIAIRAGLGLRRNRLTIQNF